MVRELRLNRSTPPLRRGHLAEAAATWVVGGLALVGVVVLGSVLAVVFAATLAVAVIDARKVGHSWVAYGWDKDA
jgi:hypothetical protein